MEGGENFDKRYCLFCKTIRAYSKHQSTCSYFLSANCFGDYYVRAGISYAQREAVTFCILAAQGGCEPQLTSHAAANLRVGNGAQMLKELVLQMLPYIGYPRALNALACLRKACGN